MWVCVNGCTYSLFVIGEDGYARCKRCGGLVVYKTPVNVRKKEKKDEETSK